MELEVTGNSTEFVTTAFAEERQKPYVNYHIKRYPDRTLVRRGL